MNQVQLIGNLTRAVEIKQYGATEDKVFGRTMVACRATANARAPTTCAS
jgi:single-stranded DNA-binding protein